MILPFFRHLHQRLRIQNTWRYKAPFIIAIPYFMLLAGQVPPGPALAAIAASLVTIWGIAGVAYFFNDWADLESDRKAGKPNALEAMGKTARFGTLVFLFTAALAPWLYLPITNYTAGLLGTELLLFILYACPPFRLKERGILGPVADSLYAHTIPTVLAGLTFLALADTPYPGARRFLALLGCWQFLAGLRNILLHQVLDHAHDLAAGTRTLAVRFSPAPLAAVIRYLLVPMELLAFAGWLMVVQDTLSWIWWTYPAFLVQAVFRIRILLGNPPPSGWDRLYKYVDDYYIDWIPVIFLAALGLESPLFLGLAVLHLLLFRNGVTLFLREGLQKLSR